jgi:hypothetical protein
MANWTGYLSAAELNEVANAIVSTGLALPDKLNAILLALPARFVGTLDGWGLPPGLRTKALLQQMNRVHNLVTGEVPLALFLTTVLDATADAAAIMTFEQALTKVNRYNPPAVGSPDEAGLPTSAVPVTSLAGANMQITPEVQIGDFDTTLSVAFLSHGLEAAASVFKIVIHRHLDGVAEIMPDGKASLSNGTGWVIAPGIGITNHHVINARSKLFGEPDASPEDLRLQAERARVVFDYLSDDNSTSGVELGAGTLLASDPGLDFALLRLPAEVANRRPMRLRSLKIAKTAQQALGIRVNVLQHPDGKPMRLGFRRNFVVIGDDDVLAYLTDTASGSSGSPVCDDAWKVAALHCGARAVSDQGLELMGKLVRRANTGTPLPTILHHLAAHHHDLHAAIMAGQAGAVRT